MPGSNVVLKRGPGFALRVQPRLLLSEQDQIVPPAARLRLA